MSDLRYATYLAFVLGVVGLAHWLNACAGSTEPARDALQSFCVSELTRLGATPERAATLCQTGGALLEEELAKLRERASVAAAPCGGTTGAP